MWPKPKLKKKRSCNHNHLCDDWKKLNHVTAEHDMTKFWPTCTLCILWWDKVVNTCIFTVITWYLMFHPVSSSSYRHHLMPVYILHCKIKCFISMYLIFAWTRLDVQCFRYDNFILIQRNCKYHECYCITCL